MDLRGGLLEWVPETNSFKRLDTSKEPFNFFITSYTPIDNNRAIFGTSNGFGEDVKGRFQSFSSKSENQSYTKLKKEHPSLFLGTEGANLEDFWLFGTAAGIVAFQNDMWFYPKKINQLLPQDIEFGQYGGRCINSIVTDPNGKIYAGTDLGLLIYNSGSPDPTSFLLDNDMTLEALAYYNGNMFSAEGEVLLKDVPKNSEAGTLISDIEKNKGEIQKLQKLKGNSQQENMSSIDTRDKLNNDSITQVIVDLKRKQVDLLLKLQQKEPALYQALRIPPLDLLASKDKMVDDECIIQYMPMSKKLFIQFISKDKLTMKEVDIDGQTLMDTCIFVATHLALNANIRGASALTTESDSNSEDDLINALSFLYETLIRPVESDINRYNNVYFVPVKSMNYVPFGALINKKTEKDYSYAIEDLNIGYLSSMYLFDLVHNFKPSSSNKCVIFADPDFSLPGAKDEAIEIKNIVKTELLFTGKKASIKNFNSNIVGCKIIHLATHGYLDDKSLNNSWLLFANDKKYNMIDAFNLPLDETELVVLSACETALGGEGLEYATLTRAFTNSGARTVMGTLWSVDDLASKELMINFYTNLAAGDNKFEALAKAKRSLIHSDNDSFTHPSKWSPYISIGKY